MQLIYLIATLLLRNKIQFYKVIGLDRRDIIKFQKKIIRTNVEY